MGSALAGQRHYEVREGGTNVWTSVINKSYSILSYVQTNASPGFGLVPDFISGANTATPVPAPLTLQTDAYGASMMMYLEASTDNKFYSNACRVPWRIATDYLISGDARAKTVVTALNTGFQIITGSNVANLKSGYGLNGVALYIYSSQEVNVSLVPAAMLGTNQVWMDDLYNNMISTATPTYYEATLKMLSMLVVSNNWWAP